MKAHKEARLQDVLTAARAIIAMAERASDPEMKAAIETLAAALEAYDSPTHLTPPVRRVKKCSWGKAYWAEDLGWVSIPDGD